MPQMRFLTLQDAKERTFGLVENVLHLLSQSIMYCCGFSLPKDMKVAPVVFTSVRVFFQSYQGARSFD